MTRKTTTPGPHEPPKHDAAYKSMFGNWGMVEQLLRGLFGDLARGLDLSALRRLPADFVITSGLLRRAADRLWRVDFHDPQLAPLIILLEFQSTRPSESPRLYRLACIGTARPNTGPWSPLKIETAQSRSADRVANDVFPGVAARVPAGRGRDRRLVRPGGGAAEVARSPVGGTSGPGRGGEEMLADRVPRSGTRKVGTNEFIARAVRVDRDGAQTVVAIGHYPSLVRVDAPAAAMCQGYTAIVDRAGHPHGRGHRRDRSGKDGAVRYDVGQATGRWRTAESWGAGGRGAFARIRPAVATWRRAPAPTTGAGIARSRGEAGPPDLRLKRHKRRAAERSGSCAARRP